MQIFSVWSKIFAVKHIGPQANTDRLILPVISHVMTGVSFSVIFYILGVITVLCMLYYKKNHCQVSADSHTPEERGLEQQSLDAGPVYASALPSSNVQREMEVRMSKNESYGHLRYIYI